MSTTPVLAVMLVVSLPASAAPTELYATIPVEDAARLIQASASVSVFWMKLRSTWIRVTAPAAPMAAVSKNPTIVLSDILHRSDVPGSETACVLAAPTWKNSQFSTVIRCESVPVAPRIQIRALRMVDVRSEERRVGKGVDLGGRR